MSDTEPTAEPIGPTTLDEAICAEENAQKTADRVRTIAFDPPIFVAGRSGGPSTVNRYVATESQWKDWTVECVGTSVVLEQPVAGRRIVIPAQRCVIEYAPSCPRCRAFLLKPSPPCVNPDCTWPKAIRRVCPECRSRIGEGKIHCPNPKCRWGWTDPDERSAVEMAKDAMKAAHPEPPPVPEPPKPNYPTCTECGGKLVKGDCILGHAAAAKKREMKT